MALFEIVKRFDLIDDLHVFSLVSLINSVFGMEVHQNEHSLFYVSE